MAVWIAVLVVPLVIDTVKNGANNNGGPTWRWLAGIGLSAAGVLFGWWATSVSGQLSDIQKTLAEIPVDHQVTTENTTQIQQLWEKYGLDHEARIRDEVMQQEDHNLLHNWVHPDHKGQP